MKVAFHSLGCKVNQYETTAMAQALEAAGYETVPETSAADIYIVNTCSVTGIADRKSRQMLHRVKKYNPDAVVVAVGCYVQAAGAALLEDEGIDIAIGNDKKAELVQILAEYMENRRSVACIEDISRPRPYEELRITGSDTGDRAYIKIQDGCNQFCSYCIIPLTRGRIRSRKAEDIVDEARRLVESGIKEIVLTGIHVSSYGMESGTCNADYVAGGRAGDALAGLIGQIAEKSGVSRIRLSSLEPRIITKEFAARLAAVPQLCPHFHLSLQSGSDSVLKRMNRHYTCEEYAASIAILRECFDDPGLTTDLIAGFPQETDAEFEETLEFVKNVGLCRLHVFRYSPRKNTVAARMKGQVPEEIKAARSERLIALSAELEKEFAGRWKGKRAKVLWEEEITVDGKRALTGYTREYIRVTLPAELAGAEVGNISEVVL